MAEIIKMTGEITSVVPESKNGKFTLSELQGAVGGYIELVHLADGRLMVVNEEGKLMDLSLNMKATTLVARVGIKVFNSKLTGDAAIRATGGIAGDVLVCDDNQID